MGFNLNDYEPVAARLNRWLEDCIARGVRGRVITDLREHTGTHAVFIASIFEDELLVATGWAAESAAERGVNATSHLENCETSAVGRALANAGWAGTDVNKRPSQEEMRKVKVASKAAHRPPEAPNPVSGTEIPESNTYGRKTPTEKMAKFLSVLADRTGAEVPPGAFEDFDLCRSEIDRLQSLNS